VPRRNQPGERDALTYEERAGFQLFVGRARCSACHVGPNFTDGEFHNTGVAVTSGDRGRMAVTGAERDRGAFRTPTLREIARTAPYMHDGTAALTGRPEQQPQGPWFLPGRFTTARRTRRSHSSR
jgi:cytochrome c peroxidase